MAGTPSGRPPRGRRSLVLQSTFVVVLPLYSRCTPGAFGKHCPRLVPTQVCSGHLGIHSLSTTVSTRLYQLLSKSSACHPNLDRLFMFLGACIMLLCYSGGRLAIGCLPNVGDTLAIDIPWKGWGQAYSTKYWRTHLSADSLSCRLAPVDEWWYAR